LHFAITVADEVSACGLPKRTQRSLGVIDDNQSTVQSLIWVLFDAHSDSSATILADNPKVENFTTRDGFLSID